MEQASAPASNFRRPRSSFCDWQNIIKLLYVGLMFMSYLSCLLMAPIDFALMESQKPQGATYGMPFWQFNQTALASPVFLADIAKWRQLNLIRGVGGILAWGLSFLVWREVEAESEYKVVPV
jgi:hypothetical protein